MRSRTLQKLGLRPDDVDDILGSRKLREEMVQAGWLRPVVQRHKLTLYDAGEVTRAWARILAGETLNSCVKISKAKTKSLANSEAPASKNSENEAPSCRALAARNDHFENAKLQVRDTNPETKTN